jgi:hypothetical protein
MSERAKLIKNSRRWVNRFEDDDGTIIRYSERKGIAVVPRKCEGIIEIIERSKYPKYFKEIVEYCKTFQ